MTEFQKDLEKYIEEYIIVLRAKKHLAQLEKRIANTKIKLSQLSDVLEKEYADVVKLERSNLHNLFSH